jgi:hypothetical protein
MLDASEFLQKSSRVTRCVASYRARNWANSRSIDGMKVRSSLLLLLFEIIIIIILIMIIMIQGREEDISQTSPSCFSASAKKLCLETELQQHRFCFLDRNSQFFTLLSWPAAPN